MDQQQLLEELRQVRETMVDALNRRDLDELVRHLDPAVVFTPLNNAVCRGIPAVREYFARQLDGPTRVLDDIQVTLQADDSRIFIGDRAVVSTGDSVGVYTLRSGPTLRLDSRWSAVLVRGEGGWRIAAFHASTNLFNNPLLHRLRRMAIAAAILAAVVGLVAGLLLAQRG